MFFQFADARPGRLLAQACAASRNVMAILCATPMFTRRRLSQA